MRFHDLSRRGSRVVGRSDTVLHRFGEAKPSRNGCIVVRPQPAGAMYFLLNAKQGNKHLIFLLVAYVHQINPGEGKRALRFALIPPPDPYPLSLTLSICAKPWRASIPVGLCRRKIVLIQEFCIEVFLGGVVAIRFRNSILTQIKSPQESILSVVSFMCYNVFRGEEYENCICTSE